MLSKKISVILPTLNERGNISLLLDELHQELKPYEHEILVIDDDSSDGTCESVLQRNDQHVKAILRKDNHGLASSIRCGIENATGELLVVMDSDFNHQPKYLPLMINSLGCYDCVVASRFKGGGKMNYSRRQKLSRLFNSFVNLMTGGAISDNLYGFFAIKKEILARYDFNKIFFGFGDYYIRLLFFLQKDKVSILQFPAVNGERKSGQSNKRLLRAFFQYFLTVIKLRG